MKKASVPPRLNSLPKDRRSAPANIPLALLCLCGWVLIEILGDSLEPPKSSGPALPAGDARTGGSLPKDSDEIRPRAGRQGKERKSGFRFTAIALAIPPDDADAVVDPLYRMGGSGTRGAIRDRAGNEIWRATKDHPAYSIAVIPDDGRIAVGAGDGNAYIITSEGEKIADLPRFPPGRNMLGMGNWVWLDNDRLLGESGVEKVDDRGKPVGCCEGHGMSESRFFIYDIRTGRMGGLKLPEDLQGKVVSIGKVLKTGEFHLGHEGDDFGWYLAADLGATP